MRSINTTPALICALLLLSFCVGTLSVGVQTQDKSHPSTMESIDGAKAAEVSEVTFDEILVFQKANENAAAKNEEIGDSTLRNGKKSSLNLANSIVSSHKSFKNFLAQVGQGFQETMTESSTRNRAIYIFVAVCLLVVLCCIGLQFILTMAKDSKIALNKFERIQRERAVRGLEDAVDQH